MVALTSPEDRHTVSPRTIPAHTQLLAVAWLRWRIFVNTFRRQRTGTGRVMTLIFVALMRTILFGVFGVALIGAASFCGFLAWKSVADGHSLGLVSLLAGISVAWQFFAINSLSIAATVPSFDPSSLARF